MVSNTMSNNVNTKAGIRPDENELPFSISTHQVEEYLQKKVNAVVNRIGEEDVQIQVYSTEAGKAFIPFMVILPTSVMKNGKNKSQDKSIPRIFLGGVETQEDTSANMKEEFYKVFSPYIYSKTDEAAFFSEDWRRARKVNRDTSPILKRYRTPRVSKFNNGKETVVMLMIDPMRVFHDMLTIPDDNRQFKPEVTGWRKVQDGDFIYQMRRVLNKNNKKKYKYTAMDELNRKMRIRK